MIHQYRLNGFNIVLDVNSGSVHCVDDVAYDIISLFCAEKLTRDEIVQKIAAEYPEITEEEIFEIFEDIDELEEAGKIFAPDIYEPRAYDSH